ncbi:MAG: hypothetical protein KJ879_00875 [Nanoarchaeota archaeon]|nr:hypothetical protein [Nanoarchaeota archaeon]
MKRVLIVSLMLVFVLGMLINSPLVLADSINAGVGNSDESNTAAIDNSEDSDDDSEDDDSTRVRTETRIRVRDGEDGREIRSERKIRIKDGQTEIRTRLKVEGNGANLSIVDSEGERHRIRVTPEKLRVLIMERLKANNITEFSIDEIEHKNIPRVVYKVNSEHQGRFLGIIKISMKVQTQIDPETGEIIDVNTPWWTFIITGEKIADKNEIIGNETLESEIVSDDEELEKEFGNIEIDEELEINVETLNGSSEIEVELEFETETTNTDDVISEILSKLILSSEEIDSLLEIGESDEPLGNDEELKVEVELESEDGLTEVEFEWKFIIDSDNRQVIVNAIIERLFSLTAEDINNILILETDDDEDEKEENEDIRTQENK